MGGDFFLGRSFAFWHSLTSDARRKIGLASNNGSPGKPDWRVALLRVAFFCLNLNFVTRLRVINLFSAARGARWRARPFAEQTRKCAATARSSRKLQITFLSLPGSVHESAFSQSSGEFCISMAHAADEFCARKQVSVSLREEISRVERKEMRATVIRRKQSKRPKKAKQRPSASVAFLLLLLTLSGSIKTLGAARNQSLGE